MPDGCFEAPPADSALASMMPAGSKPTDGETGISVTTLTNPVADPAVARGAMLNDAAIAGRFRPATEPPLIHPGKRGLTSISAHSPPAVRIISTSPPPLQSASSTKPRSREAIALGKSRSSADQVFPSRLRRCFSM